MRRSISLTIALIGCACLTGSCLWADAQRPHYNFRHLAASQGLADGVVNAIGQDKYGYIWIGTISGLNRYNGYSVQHYFHDEKDNSSLPPGRVQSIFCDGAGQVWIGFPDCLVRYDHPTGRFVPVVALSGVSVFKMIQAAPEHLLLATNKGLAILDLTAAGQSVEWTGNGPDSLPGSQKAMHDLCHAGDRLYAATDSGLLVMTLSGRPVRRVLSPVKNAGIDGIAVDGSGNCWVLTGENSNLLARSDSSFAHWKVYNNFRVSVKGETGDRIVSMLVDNKGALWFTTVGRGLVTYSGDDHFVFYDNNYMEPYSISANQLTQLYQGRQGYIWIGTEGNGVDYFHPDKNLFEVILPDDSLVHRLSSLWARAYLTDRRSHHWMGMGWGLIETDEHMRRLRFFHNGAGGPAELHINSVRSLLEDDAGRIWIGTAEGINRYDPSTKKMSFLDQRDSLDRGFVWTMMEDSRKTTWFGMARNFFYKTAGSDKIHSIAMHPDLRQFTRKGVRSICEDSHHRLWFGMNGAGLIRYDPVTREIRHWRGPGKEQRTLIGNIVTSIAEDRRGIMWFSTFDGLCSYDGVTDRFDWYNDKNGLPSLKTSGLLIDSRDRLWIGSTMGLLMLDSSRRSFKTFDLLDGLLTMEFSDLPAYASPDGRFIYPTLKGFVAFDPNEYKENPRQVQAFLTAYTIAGQPSRQHIEELPGLYLGADENFFSLELTAFNYDNPQQTWYAYKLEGFDRDWTYTRERHINYTNVPGGRYSFHYKATSDPSNWQTPEKIWPVTVGTHFYQTWWFAVTCLLALALIAYLFYRGRLLQQRKLFMLQNKAQSLEKEKVIVRYESLKQQLNPHFLFNYLSSLRILIRTNPGLAGEFLEWMSRVYRYVLQSRDHETVPLKEEIAFVSNFVHLQKTRYAEGLVVNIDVSEEEQSWRIAPVTLQNLLENAIKHNSIDVESPLVIDVYVEGSYLVVRNNLQRKEYVPTSNQVGLKNMVSLYRYLTRQPVEIREDANYYAIKIPMI